MSGMSRGEVEARGLILHYEVKWEFEKAQTRGLEPLNENRIQKENEPSPEKSSFFRSTLFPTA